MTDIIVTAVVCFLLGALVMYLAMRLHTTTLVKDRSTLVDEFKTVSDPVATSLTDLNQRISEVEKERTRMTAEMREQISTMRRETVALSTALRTPQVRGAWGEQSLRRLVELSGLTARCDFDEQASYGTAERQRPDMRINLADGKVIFVDSKAPLSAVLEAYQCEDSEEQAGFLRQFARHVRTHIDQLAKKEYWALDTGSPEFVVLYLPSDEFYRLALEHIPDLHDYATRRNITLACPGTLIPLLQIVAHGWKQASLAESALEIATLGRELHARLGTMGQHFGKLQRGLEAAVGAYNQAMGSFESRVMVTARKLNDYDVANSELPPLPQADAVPRVPAIEASPQ